MIDGLNFDFLKVFTEVEKRKKFTFKSTIAYAKWFIFGKKSSFIIFNYVLIS